MGKGEAVRSPGRREIHRNVAGAKYLHAEIRNAGSAQDAVVVVLLGRDSLGSERNGELVAQLRSQGWTILIPRCSQGYCWGRTTSIRSQLTDLRLQCDPEFTATAATDGNL